MLFLKILLIDGIFKVNCIIKIYILTLTIYLKKNVNQLNKQEISNIIIIGK